MYPSIKGEGASAEHQTDAPSGLRRSLAPSLDRGALYFRWGHRDSIPVLQDTVLGHRLAVDADQVIRGLSPREFLAEELLDRSARLNVQVIGKAAAIVVNEENPHGHFLSKVVDVLEHAMRATSQLQR